eukprot:7974539-Pyramimonas_sp.AAC.1
MEQTSRFSRCGRFTKIRSVVFLGYQNLAAKSPNPQYSVFRAKVDLYRTPHFSEASHFLEPSRTVYGY